MLAGVGIDFLLNDPQYAMYYTWHVYSVDVLVLSGSSSWPFGRSDLIADLV